MQRLLSQWLVSSPLSWNLSEAAPLLTELETILYTRLEVPKLWFFLFRLHVNKIRNIYIYILYDPYRLRKEIQNTPLWVLIIKC